MTKIQFKAFPRGCCVRCLEKWRDGGLPRDHQELGDGRALLAG
jgi:hypothetical protein